MTLFSETQVPQNSRLFRLQKSALACGFVSTVLGIAFIMPINSAKAAKQAPERYAATVEDGTPTVHHHHNQNLRNAPENGSQKQRHAERLVEYLTERDAKKYNEQEAKEFNVSDAREHYTPVAQNSAASQLDDPSPKTAREPSLAEFLPLNEESTQPLAAPARLIPATQTRVVVQEHPDVSSGTLSAHLEQQLTQQKILRLELEIEHLKQLLAAQNTQKSANATEAVARSTAPVAVTAGRPSADVVPKKHLQEVSKRLKLTEKLLKQYGLAFDYKSLSYNDLVKIENELKQQKM